MNLHEYIKKLQKEGFVISETKVYEGDKKMEVWNNYGEVEVIIKLGPKNGGGN